METLLLNLLSGAMLPVSLMDALSFKNVWGVIGIVCLILFIIGFFVFRKITEKKNKTDDISRIPVAPEGETPPPAEKSAVCCPEIPTIYLLHHVVPVEVVSVVDLCRNNHIITPGGYPYIVGSRNNALLGIRVWHDLVICPPVERKVSFEECLEFSKSHRRFLTGDDMRHLIVEWKNIDNQFRRCGVALEPGLYWFEDTTRPDSKSRLRIMSLPDGKLLLEKEQDEAGSCILLSKY